MRWRSRSFLLCVPIVVFLFFAWELLPLSLAPVATTVDPRAPHDTSRGDSSVGSIAGVGAERPREPPGRPTGAVREDGPAAVVPPAVTASNGLMVVAHSGGVETSAPTFPHGQTVVLQQTPLDAARLRKRRPPCPDRYIFVNTHTFGRHHNQLQEMINLVAWAERLNRTAVLGWFRHNHRWLPPSELYNFSEIQKHFCLVTPEQFGAAISAGGGGRRAKLSAVCFGQGVADTPLKRFGVSCRMVSGVPANYNVRRGARLTRQYFDMVVESADARLVVVSGEIAFFLRPGLAAVSAVLALLEPANEIAAEVDAFIARRLSPTAAAANVSSRAQPLPYFALHLRQREAECMREVTDSFEDGKDLLGTLAGDERRVIEAQCAITLPYVRSLQASLGFRVSAETPMFLASDHENMVLERALLKEGAVPYEGGRFHTKEFGGLPGLTVDFFVMVRAAYFTGNQLSSVSQNVCFVRLGRGKACHGIIPAFMAHHTRPVDSFPSAK